MHYEKGIGIVEVSGKKVCSKRESDLKLARIYGKTNDLAAFTRLQIESKVKREKLLDAFRGNETNRSSSPLETASPMDIFNGEIIRLT